MKVIYLQLTRLQDEHKILVNIAHIVYAAPHGSFVRLHTTSGPPIDVKETLESIKKALA